MCWENECNCNHKNKVVIIKQKKEPKPKKTEEVLEKEEEFRINFGKRLTSARKMKALSLEEAAKLFMISKQALNRYELGKREITSEVVIKFAKAYDLPADYFFRRGPEITFGEIRWSKKLKYC